MGMKMTVTLEIDLDRFTTTDLGDMQAVLDSHFDGISHIVAEESVHVLSAVLNHGDVSTPYMEPVSA